MLLIIVILQTKIMRRRFQNNVKTQDGKIPVVAVTYLVTDMQSDTILLYLRTRSDFSNNVKNVNYFIEQARSSLVALYDNGNDTNYDLIGRSSSIEYPSASIVCGE